MQVAVDLAPLVDNVVIPLLSSVVLALAGWALQKVASYAHFQVQDGQRQVVSAAITNGIAYAQKELAGAEHVEMDDRVAMVANYVLPKVPGALKSLGVTPDHLEDVIKARLPA